MNLRHSHGTPTTEVGAWMVRARMVVIGAGVMISAIAVIGWLVGNWAGGLWLAAYLPLGAGFLLIQRGRLRWGAAAVALAIVMGAAGVVIWATEPVRVPPAVAVTSSPGQTSAQQSGLPSVAAASTPGASYSPANSPVESSSSPGAVSAGVANPSQSPATTAESSSPPDLTPYRSGLPSEDPSVVEVTSEPGSGGGPSLPSAASPSAPSPTTTSPTTSASSPSKSHPAHPSQAAHAVSPELPSQAGNRHDRDRAVTLINEEAAEVGN